MPKDRILVVKIKDGVVDEAKLFTEVKRAEECFTLECLNAGASKDKINTHLDDGYFTGGNFSICITYPEIL